MWRGPTDQDVRYVNPPLNFTTPAIGSVDLTWDTNKRANVALPDDEVAIACAKRQVSKSRLNLYPDKGE